MTCYEDEALLTTGECKPVDDLSPADTVQRVWDCTTDGNRICGTETILCYRPGEAFEAQGFCPEGSEEAVTYIPPVALAYTGGYAAEAGVYGAALLLTGALLCAVKRLSR